MREIVQVVLAVAAGAGVTTAATWLIALGPERCVELIAHAVRGGL